MMDDGMDGCMGRWVGDDDWKYGHVSVGEIKTLAAWVFGFCDG